MSAIDVTRGDLIRALVAMVSARPAVDTAVRERAESIAARVATAGVAVRVLRRGHGDYAVEASGAGLFAREFGSIDAPVDPVLGHAVGGQPG